jgi:hypothetical protein
LDESNKNDYHLSPEYAKLHSTQRAEQELCMNPSFSAAEALEEPTIGVLRTWERAMRRGVDAARGGHLRLAEDFYLQALGLAQPLLDAGCAERADDRIAAFVVTHLNLSDLHRDAERTEDAVAHLCVAHCRLMALLRDPQAEPALQHAARRHSRETHAALVAHLGEHGGHPAILAALRAGCMPFPPPGITLH